MNTLLILIWVVCSVADYGFNFAYFQREYPTIAEEHYKEDIIMCAITSLAGPASLIGTILMWIIRGKFPLFKHGIKFL